MASLTGENHTTVFIIAPELSSVSIAHGFEQDATKKGEDQKVLESQTAVMLGTAPLSMTHGLKQDVVMTKEHEVVEKLKKEMGSLTDEEIMEKLSKDLELATKEVDEAVLMELKTELELKYLKVYRLRLLNLEMVFESQKLMFTRALEEAWFINSIIKERCLNMCHSGEGDHLTHHKIIEKVVKFNKKIKFANFLGLDHWLYGPSNKRKRPSYQTYDQALEEAVEEYNENLRNCNETAPQILVNPPEDIEKFGNCSKKTYRRAYPFTKLESREEYLQSVINSLQERETERPIEETEIEILGFMLLKEIADCTLKISSSDLLNYITLSPGSCSGDGAEQDRNIHVQLDKQLYFEYANLLCDFDASFTSRYNAFMKEAKSDCNNSNNEKEKIKEKLTLVEECIRKAIECHVIDKHHQNVWSVWRQYERELFKYCEHLSYYMRLGRCLNPLSETEKDRLKQIGDLARAVIGKYTKANGSDSLPTITQPLLPSWRNY